MSLKEISELVGRFKDNLDEYRSPAYNETQVRRDFIDPFFEALGWDVFNKQGFSQTFRQVIHEDSLIVEGSTKAPDYCFQLGGRRVFFVEAKKPAVDLKESIHPAYQLRRYAWSAKLPISILTDFDEFVVYDCRIKPNQTDKASAARVMYLRYDEYADKWAELTGLFSPGAIQQGALERYIVSTKSKRGTAQVDDSFLEEIESWRELLAKSIALRNPDLSTRDLNFTVQRTIDRIIFLRICEDRGIETYATLQEFQNGANTYERLVEYFRRADERYNSGLFHFKDEKDQCETPDILTPRIKIDDKPLKDILKKLYYPECPYEFSVLGADILGSVYERFLGKVIRLTAGHRAVVEEKPEVRKAGGVYYTPTYIVDYIVKNTVGKLLEGKTPKQAADLRILDPACGSGSFLLGAYQCLLDWHVEQYVKDPEKWGKGKDPALYKSHEGDWKLTTQERKRILLNNIYGVDKDSQAVEVTKLSLLLKVLEGENGETISKQLKLFHQRALPDLGSNIKCGNSLIGSDFYQQQTLDSLSDEEHFRVNVFDWYRAYPETIKRGGFDAVIGNPPYGASISDSEISYLRDRFSSSSKDTDTYALFIEKAIALLRSHGVLSMIVPTGWYSGKKFVKLRQFVASNTDPIAFINLPYDIFSAWVDTTIIVARKRACILGWPRMEKSDTTIITFPKRYRINFLSDFDRVSSKADISQWFKDGSDLYLTYADTQKLKLISKIQEGRIALGEVADVQRGVTPFHLTIRPDYKTSKRAFAGTIRRYSYDAGPEQYLRYDETLAEYKPARYFAGTRILLRELISRQFRLQAMIVHKDFITNKSMQSILQVSGGPGLYYILAILNSKLMSWYFLQRSNVGQRDDFPKIVLKETRTLPIARASKAAESIIESLSQQLEILAIRLIAEHDSKKHDLVKNQFDSIDSQLDHEIYRLYQLSEEEIETIEGSYNG